MKFLSKCAFSLSFTLCFFFTIHGQVFTTIDPYVASANTSYIKISKIEVSRYSTTVYFKVLKSSVADKYFKLSGITLLSDYDSKELELLRGVDFKFTLPPYPIGTNNQTTINLWIAAVQKVQADYLETKKSLSGVVAQGIKGIEFNRYYKTSKLASKSEDYSFSVTFNGLPPGVKSISIIDLAEDGLEFSGIQINNPDVLEHTEYSKSSLIEHWNTIGLDYVEGIYEVVSANDDQHEYEFGIVQAENGVYHLIYLNGTSKNGWKKGSVKGYLKPTASSNIFQSDYYLFDKSIKSVMISFSEAGMLIDIGDGSILKCLKTYPSTQGDNETIGMPENSNPISSGTGFAISQNGYIVTNHHVIENANKIHVIGIGGDFSKKFLAEVILSDTNNDLAILKIIDPKFKGINPIPYNISIGQVDVGTSVYALGYPLRASMGDEVKYTNGSISSKSGFKGDLTVYQMSVPVQPGNSGGPLLNINGTVVGIVNAKHNNAENVSYAIKSSYLLNLIENLEPSIQPLKNNTLQNKSITEQIKVIKNFVYIIEIR